MLAYKYRPFCIGEFPKICDVDGSFYNVYCSKFSVETYLLR